MPLDPIALGFAPGDVKAVVELDAGIAAILPHLDWAADPRLGPCSGCGELHHRYGDEATSSLCSACRSPLDPGGEPPAAPTQPTTPMKETTHA